MSMFANNPGIGWKVVDPGTLGIVLDSDYKLGGGMGNVFDPGTGI